MIADEIVLPPEIDGDPTPEVQRLRLEPGDVLVAKFTNPSQDTIERFNRILKHVAPGVPVICIDQNVELLVVNRESLKE